MGLTEWFEFQVPGRVVCSEHSVDSIGTELDKIGANNVLIITDKGVEKAGLVELVENGLESGSAKLSGIFNEVPPNSEIKVVQRCYEMVQSVGADSLVSIGGGSSIDTAKATAILMCEGGNLLDHQSAVYAPSGTLPPHIAVPTTAGTGSESTFASVIADEEQKLKLIFQGPALAPTVALLDPVMTKTLPPHLTASTGMDALSHCIESIHSEMHEPISDGLALHAIRLISNYLPKATKNGDDMEARTYMLIAANMGGIAFANAYVGIVHAMAHAAGGRYGVPHGVANAILLPYGVEYNVKFYPELVLSEYRLVAEALGIDVQGDNDEKASEKLIEYLKNLTLDLGLPAKLSEVGVPQDGLEDVANDAMIDGSMFNNPGEPELEDVLDILKKAY
ncbi:MAG: iron-containing alcohol dehydrogenase [Actinomycetota bacterium]|nr:iron-containing alcohol dehydrogenase [Actinomycetota bacterium]